MDAECIRPVGGTGVKAALARGGMWHRTGSGVQEHWWLSCSKIIFRRRERRATLEMVMKSCKAAITEC